MNVSSYGTTTRSIEIDESLRLPIEELTRNGFTVLQAEVSAALLRGMRDALDRLLVAQTVRFGADRLDAINDSSQARALLEEEPIFLELLRLPRVEAIVEALLGPAALVMQQNGIVMPQSGAAHHQQNWHRDLPYQSWVATAPLALGCLAALDAFTPESGATRFLPGSHRHATLPSDVFIERWAYPAYTEPGGVILFDAMCFHAGGVNRGAAPRRAVNTLFGVPLLAQQVAFTAKPGMDARMRRRLGLDYQPAASADAWRAARHTRLTSGS